MKKTKNLTYLNEIIARNEYFQRSINIALDSEQLEIIQNFYCPISYEQVIVKMLTLINANQGAFTWTGAFGSGKSSLALFLQSLASSDTVIKKTAINKLSDENKELITQFFDKKNEAWHIINLVGSSTSPETLFIQSLDLPKDATHDDIFDKLSEVMANNQRLMIFIDEMGKILESVNRGSHAKDIYFFQQLAEFVNHSQGKAIFVGILHQSFTAYARQAHREIYNEWMKIQGRFIDCTITLSVDEQLHLISQVIKVQDETFLQQHQQPKLTHDVAENIAENKPTAIEKLTDILLNVFPLHPLVAVLLCQLSKKNFGQNQRSIFSFLMSAEPHGFGEYLKYTPTTGFEVYQPDEFWDYIDSNLGSMVLSSEYAKQWLLTQSAISRYQVRDNPQAIALIKIISLISMLAGDTGVHASFSLLQSLTGLADEPLKQLLTELEDSTLIFYSKFKQSYWLNEGSDFNLSKTIEEYLPDIQHIRLDGLDQFDPIIAKRHYQETGSLRWAEVKILPVNQDNLENSIADLAKTTNASLVGYFCVLLPTNEAENRLALDLLPMLAQQYPNLIFTTLEKYSILIEYLRDSLAIKAILSNEQQLLNDVIARQETEARLQETEDNIKLILQNVLNGANWQGNLLGKKSVKQNTFQLSTLASKIADQQVEYAVICHNELVNRNAPSPNAKGAIRELVKRMIENSKEPNLGIEKYPPEKAIYESVLLKNGIHRSDDNGESYYFSKPDKNSSFAKIWQATDEFLAIKQGELATAHEIYQLWQQPPYGIKAGLCDILYVAYILSRFTEVANYIEEEYKPSLQYLLAEYLLKSAKSVGLREVSHLKNAQPWIYLLKKRLQEDFCHLLTNPIEDEPLPIAQALVAVFLSLPQWLHRTNELKPNTKILRNTLKQSNDPNKLLFDDLPKFFEKNASDEENVEMIINALQEMHQKYPDLVFELNTRLFKNIKVDEENDPFTAINNRANILWKKTGYPELESFITRLRTYKGTPKESEGIIGLLAGNKPAKSWIDQDIHKAMQQLNKLCFDFLEAEINTDMDVQQDRFKVSVILKSSAIADKFTKSAHVVPQNAKLIKDLAQTTLESKNFSELDTDSKVAVVSEMLSKIVTNQWLLDKNNGETNEKS